MLCFCIYGVLYYVRFLFGDNRSYVFFVRMTSVVRTFLFFGENIMGSEINKRVVQYRKQAHLTQSEVAEYLGMKSSTYSQMERVGDISAEKIIKLAEVFNVDVRCLLYEEKDFENSQSPTPIKELYDFPMPNSLKSICKIYNTFPKSKQKCLCNFVDYLRNCNSDQLQNITELIIGK